MCNLTVESAAMRKVFSEQLRDAIETADVSRYRLAKLTGVPASQLSRFVNRKGGLAVASIDAICKALGARLVVEPKPTAKRKRR